MELTAVDHRIPLSDGNSIPIIGFATYQDSVLTPKGSCRAGVKLAIDVGYRHIDGAYSYQNENEVGEAIREKIAEGMVKREDIFYCRKLWGTDFDPKIVLPSLQKTLQDLHLDYVDLYIMETPMALKPGDEIFPKDENGNWIVPQTNLCATWEVTVEDVKGGVVLRGEEAATSFLVLGALYPTDNILTPDVIGAELLSKFNGIYSTQALEACKDAGLVKSLGVSHFNRRQLELILNKPRLKYKPVCNQVECHPYFTQRKLLEFCQQHDILMVAFTPLGISNNRDWLTTYFEPLLEDELLNSLGKKYNKTAAQVALRFNIQRGIVVIPKSFEPTLIKENFQIFDFSLTTEEMKTIETLNRDLRLVGLDKFSGHPEYPFHDEY